MIFIIDTNVAVVANGNSQQASVECRLKCVESLNVIMDEDGKLALDDKYLILNEYKNNLRTEGQPGVGDRFLLWVLLNQTTGRIEHVKVTPTDDDRPSFREFPPDEKLRGFDLGDRKFATVALVHPEHPSILNAVDTDWWEFRDVFAEHKIRIEFLCPDDIQRLAE